MNTNTIILNEGNLYPFFYEKYTHTHKNTQRLTYWTTPSYPKNKCTFSLSPKRTNRMTSQPYVIRHLHILSAVATAAENLHLSHTWGVRLVMLGGREQNARATQDWNNWRWDNQPGNDDNDDDVIIQRRLLYLMLYPLPHQTLHLPSPTPPDRLNYKKLF